MANAGRVAIVPKGDWSAAVEYKRLDAVAYNNTLYVAKKAVPAGTVTTNTEYWMKCVVGGAGAIATEADAGIVKAGEDIGVDSTGEMSLKTDFTEQTDLAVLTGNEDRQTLFGKIAKAVSSLISHISLSATADKAGHVKLSNSSAVTDSTGLALPATEKNASLNGTMANQIAALNKSLTPKQAVAVCLKTAAQDIVANQSYKVPIDTIIANADMCTVSDNVVTVKDAGLYAVLGKAHIALNAKGTAQYTLYVNGESYCTLDCSNKTDVADQYCISGCVPAVMLDAGSTVYMTVKESTGGTGFLYGTGASSKIVLTRIYATN